MGKWKNVRIGEFLTERQGRYKPDDNAIVTYKRLDKIDFSGTIHISEKPSKTDMIIVQPGDLVISGTNVAKGAIAVYQGVEPVTATIHYSSYIFDDSVVDLEYFKYFVKSPTFIETLKKQAKGGIKTEIKPKVFLPLEISLPDLPTQKQIVKRISVNLKRVNELAKEIETQKGYAKQLRRNILQDAIEGKLTADWRKEHPVQKGNPDYDAEALFESIQKERKVDKKRKALPPILDAEKPFELPTGWKWVRLGEITTLITDGKHGDSIDQVESGYFFLSVKDIQNEQLIYANARQIIKEDFLEIHRRTNLEPGDVCIVNTGATIGKFAIAPDNKRTYYTAFQKSVAVVKLEKSFVKNKYMKYFFMRDVSRLIKKSWGSAINNLLLSDMRKEIVPLPPWIEQDKIVLIVGNILKKVDQLEQQISRRKEYTNELIKSILKKGF